MLPIVLATTLGPLSSLTIVNWRGGMGSWLDESAWDDGQPAYAQQVQVSRKDGIGPRWPALPCVPRTGRTNVRTRATGGGLSEGPPAYLQMAAVGVPITAASAEVVVPVGLPVTASEEMVTVVASGVGATAESGAGLVVVTGLVLPNERN